MTLRQSWLGIMARRPSATTPALFTKDGNAFVAGKQPVQDQVHRRLVRDVEWAQFPPSAPFLDLREGLLGRLLVALVVHGNMESLAGQLQGDGASNAAASPGDQSERGSSTGI